MYIYSLQSFKSIDIKLYEELCTQDTTICREMPKLKKGISLQEEHQRKNKKKWVCLFFMLMLYIKFHDPSSHHSLPSASVMDGQMNRQA